MRIEVVTITKETYDVGTEFQLLSSEETTVLNIPTIYGNLTDMPLKDAEILATALKTVRQRLMEKQDEYVCMGDETDESDDDDE